MTCVAFDGKMLCADGLEVYGDNVMKRDSKKIIKVGEDLVGIAGVSTECEEFLVWYRGDKDPGQFPIEKKKVGTEEGFEALVITPAGAFLYVDSPHPVPVDAPFAIGSGGEVALGAMLAGKTKRPLGSARFIR